MLARINIQTTYGSYNNKDVIDMARHPDNAQARIEYVLRYFNSRWFAFLESEDTAITICDQELQKLPQHNFFNYARAQFEKNNIKKILLLIAAAKSCIPLASAISAEAAYEASNLLYSDANKHKDITYIACLAWLSRAIILGNDEAQQDLLGNDLFKNNRQFGISTFCTVFLTTYLAGKKIAALERSSVLKYLKNSLACDTMPFIQAYHYPYDAYVLHKADSPIIKIVELLIAQEKNEFVNYFCYCMRHNIISEDIFVNLMRFYLNSSYTDQYDLRQKAINTLYEHRLLDKVYVTPQAGAMYFLTAAPPVQTDYFNQPPSAPLATNSSYYYMYSAAPQMMPIQPPQQSMLEPEYRRIIPAPATPYNSPVNSTRTPEPPREATYFSRHW